MALVVADRVQEGSTASGTGTLALLGAASGFQTFSSAIGNGNTTYYCIVDTTTGAWETGVGTVSAGSLSRDTVLDSSNAGALVSFAGNTKNVFCTVPAAKFTDAVLNTISLSSAITPATPAPGYTSLFAKSQGGRQMPAFIGPSGLDSVLQPHMAKNGWAQWKITPNSTTVSAIGTAALTATGTATAANYAVTSLHTRTTRMDYLVTTAAATAVAGYRVATNIYRVTDGFHHIFRVAPATGTATLTTNRFFCGMSTATAAPTDVDPLTVLNSCGVGYAGGDANWQIYFGGTAVVKVDTGMVKPSVDRDGPFSVIIFAPPGGSYIGVRLVNEITGVAFETTTSTTANIMAATTAAGPRAYHSVGATSSVVGLTLFAGYVETDN